MQPKTFTALLAIAINLPQAYACKMRNRSPGTVQTNPRKCMSQGVGDWTFAMTVDLFAIPSLSRDPRAGLDGVHSSTWFAIYDHTCKLRASYEPCDGLPYVIMEDFLPFVLTVAKVDMDVGRPYFSFYYGDGKYSIRNNHCVCQNTSGKGLAVQTSCRCAFLVGGKFKHARSLEDNRRVGFKTWELMLIDAQ
jgi:hypothetical protein